MSDKLETLRRRLDEAEIARDNALARIAELEEALFRPDFRFPLAWGLAPQEIKVLGALAAADGKVVTRAALMTALYPDGDWPESGKIVDVLLCRVREKLPAGVAVETVWGRGWRLAARARAVLAASGTEADAAHRAASGLWQAGRISRAEFFRRAEAAERQTAASAGRALNASAF